MPRRRRERIRAPAAPVEGSTSAVLAHAGLPNTETRSSAPKDSGDKPIATLTAQLIKDVPELQVAATLVNAFVAVIIGVPAREYRAAMGGQIAIGPERATLPAFETINGKGDLLASIFTAPFDGGAPVTTLILFAFALGMLVWLRSGHSLHLATLHPRLQGAGLMMGFAAWLVACALTYPSYAAPRRIDGLGVRLESPHAFQAGSTWSARERVYFGNLYGLLHGVDHDTMPDWSRLKRQLPTTDQFKTVRRYYDRLVTLTVWFMLALIVLSLVGSAMIRPLGSAHVLTTGLSLLLTACTVVHLAQWYYVISAYGRIETTAKLFDQILHETETKSVESRAPLPHPDQSAPVTAWPFAKPTVTESQKGPIRVQNFWPVPGPDPTFGFTVRCLMQRERDISLVRLPGDPLFDRSRVGAYSSDGVTTLNVTCRELVAGCETLPGSFQGVIISDGYARTEPSC